MLAEDLRHHHLVAADVVARAPQLDAGGFKAVLAARLTRSLLLLIARSARSLRRLLRRDQGGRSLSGLWGETALRS